MPKISEETKLKVLDATDIVDLIGTHVQLKRAGATFKGLCPFHNEKTPSFNVNPARQYYKCFGCGEGGDALTWLMSYENLPFADALKKLADAAGILIVEEAPDPEADKRRRNRSRLVELHNDVAKFMHELAMEHPAAQHARDYLQKRGFSDQVAANWLIGWMPDQDRIFFDWAKQKQIRGRDLVSAGIAGMRQEGNPRAGLYLRFKDRLMFPIKNDYGDVVAFSGRQLREDPRSGKYVNSPETDLFKKSKVIFGLDKARRPMLKAKYALLCEGQIDVIVCHEAGFDHAVAGLGTAFTSDHAKLLRRFTDNVTLCYDADAAGIKASSRAFSELSAAGIAVRYAKMPAGEDPDTFIKGQGADAFNALIKSAPEFFDALIDAARDAGHLNSPSGKADFAKEAAALLKSVADHVTQDALIEHVATRVGIGASDLRIAMTRVRTYDDKRSRDDQAEGIQPTTIDRKIASLLSLAIQSPATKEWLTEQGETLYQAGYLPGARLLSEILLADFRCATASEINVFLSRFEQADALALRPLAETDISDDPVREASEVLNSIASAAARHQYESLLSQLKNPQLDTAQRNALTSQIAAFQSLLKERS